MNKPQAVASLCVDIQRFAMREMKIIPVGLVATQGQDQPVGSNLNPNETRPVKFSARNLESREDLGNPSFQGWR